ncbi:hypothetical protein WG66_007548 [Moniliophthora roreri]|nr:hypothetical protein WG66_007548 [Moniliophthora roreri]
MSIGYHSPQSRERFKPHQRRCVSQTHRRRCIHASCSTLRSGFWSYEFGMKWRNRSFKNLYSASHMGASRTTFVSSMRTAISVLKSSRSYFITYGESSHRNFDANGFGSNKTLKVLRTSTDRA